MFAGVARAHDPWTGLGLYEEIPVSAEWREFSREFLATDTDDRARVHFDLGGCAVPAEIALTGLREGEGIGPGRDILDLDLGVLGRLTPISREWGFDRGLAIDRYYIEGFLSRHANDIRGRVLEIEDDVYTRKFGGGAVNSTDILHVDANNPRATIVADLSDAGRIRSDLFDCAIVTQTLQYIYEVRAAVAALYRILKPGGILLATFPGITRISQQEWRESWYWLFTSTSAKRLFGDVFGPENIDVQAHGNVLTAVGFLHGLAKEELLPSELDYRDPDYEVIVTVRAVKRPAA